MAKYIAGFHRMKVSGIEHKIRFEDVEKAIVRDKNLLCTMFSYAMVFLIFANISIVRSPVMGIPTASVYFLINASFLGNVFFEKKSPFLRFILGSLLLIVFLGLISWVTMMIYNLDAVRSTIVLCTVTTMSSLMSKITKYNISIEFFKDKSDA